jgi:hypothetical protein
MEGNEIDWLIFPSKNVTISQNSERRMLWNPLDMKNQEKSL